MITCAIAAKHAESVYPDVRRAFRRAFSLVELLVVFAILSVLAAMLLPSIERSFTVANTVQCASNQRQIGTALMCYVGDFSNRLPPGDNYVSDLRSVYTPGNPFKGLGCLIFGNYLGSPTERLNEPYFCPGHQYHGSAYYAAYGLYSKHRGDYMVGWQSNFDNGVGGTYMSFAQASTTASYYPQGSHSSHASKWTFRMTLEDYARRLKKQSVMLPSGSERIGMQVLMLDYVFYDTIYNLGPGWGWDGAYGQYRTPTDVPHGGMGNMLLVDGAVLTREFPVWYNSVSAVGAAWNQAERLAER